MRPALILSLVLHVLALAFFLFDASQPKTQTARETATLSTRVLSEKDFLKATRASAKRAQIIQADEQLKSDLAPNESDDLFLARHHQRVDHNTRAPRIGKFKNVLKEGVRDSKDLFKLASDDMSRAPASETTKQGQTLRFPAAIASQDPVDQGEGYSATDDYLPHVAIGANTLLNAREYKYASFFERIREKLTHQWQTRLRNELEGLYIQGVRGLSGERTTKLRVILDPHGEIVRIEKEGSAGYLELDRAAVGAFHAASPFPNPPKDLLEGKVPSLSIDWHFVVVGDQNTGLKMRVERVPAGYR